MKKIAVKFESEYSHFDPNNTFKIAVCKMCADFYRLSVFDGCSNLHIFHIPMYTTYL